MGQTQAQAVRAEAPVRAGRLGGEILQGLRGKPLGAFGGALLAFMVVMAAVGPYIVPADPFNTSMAERLLSPSLTHPLGTDELGRDQLARIVYGARISMMVGIIATVIGTSIGAVVGIVSGYVGGRVDMLVQRAMDVLLAFPALILALAIMAALGSSIPNVIIAISIPFIARSNRVVRSAALAVKEFPYIEAALALGLPQWRIVARHMLPNCMAPYIVIATALLGSAILIEASLSFLGLGVPPPQPSWGRSLSESMLFFQRAPWLAIFPGVAISLAVFGVNLFGDALRDIWDPRLKRL